MEMCNIVACVACVQDEEEWNLIEETKGREADFPVKTGTDHQSHAYTVDDDGITVENVWESMSYEELRHVCSHDTSSSPNPRTIFLRRKHWTRGFCRYLCENAE
jgi:hypothetical protein